MPKDFSRPETLTKEALRKELKKRGIALPDPRALKQEYIDLYKRKVLRKKSVGFSSDEDEIKASVTRIRTRTATKNLSPRVQLSKVEIETMTIDGIQVSELSDAELAKALRRHGVDVGPIGPSTRRVYERKLAKALSGEWVSGDSPKSQDVNGGYSDHDSADDEEEDEDVEVETPPAMREMRSKRRTLLESGANKDGSATRRRPLRARPFEDKAPIVTEKATPIPEAKEALKPDRRWVPVWVQFLIVIAIAVFFYLVSQSMESNPQKRIPV